MVNREEIKYSAEVKCKANSNRLALIYFIYMLIVGTTSITLGEKGDGLYELTVSITGVLGLILTGPMTYGIVNVTKINYNGICPEVNSLFEGFKYFGKLVVLNLLIGLYTFLWSLLLIIPGIIKGFSYSFAYYIFLDNPELSPNECIEKSKEITNGYKAEIFFLNLSYIGWIILCVLTLGILELWVGPKIETANYELYLIASGKKNRILETEFEKDFYD